MTAAILLAQRTWPEVRDLLATNQVVLVPVGAHEQHGLGIAMATDTISADGLCRRAAALLGDRAAVAPAVPYGVSWHHMRFPGTISIPDAAFQGWFKAFFTFAVPMLLVANVPAKLLVDKLSSPFEMVLLVAMSGACFALSELVWRFSVRHYTSASS